MIKGRFVTHAQPYPRITFALTGSAPRVAHLDNCVRARLSPLDGLHGISAVRQR